VDGADSWLSLAFLLCLALSGFFSSAEAAFISLPKLRIRYLVESGVKGARQLAKATDRSERFLAAFLSVLGAEGLLTHLRNRKAKATVLRDIKEEIMMNIAILDNSIRTTQQMRNEKGMVMFLTHMREEVECTPGIGQKRLGEAGGVLHYSVE